MIRILPPYWGREEFLAIARFMFRQAASPRLKEGLEAFVYPKKVLLTASGSAAILMILQSLKLDKGSKVLVPSFVCSKVVHVIQSAGLTPRYVDVDETLLMDPADLDRKVDADSRVVIMPHIYGKRCDVPSIKEIARRRGLILIDDAAAAFLPGLSSPVSGTEGDYGVFSFNYKLISAVMGGGIICDAKDEGALDVTLRDTTDCFAGKDYRKILVKHMYQRVWHRVDPMLFPRSMASSLSTAITTNEFGMRPCPMHPLTQSLAAEQCGKLARIVKRLNTNSAALRILLEKNDNVRVVTSAFGDYNTRFVILLKKAVPRDFQTKDRPWEDRDRFRAYLFKKGVQAFYGYTPAHIVSGSGDSLPKTEALWQRCLIVSNNPLYGPKDMGEIASAINEYRFEE